ncbi:PfkB family carbohydrate kinase [uncultured Jannaschia sp.]|uniref:carbohydrate kinase family protein n=1 Tax=uncultured Jannaschia sp. TaxID=293347 RepID=UPI0026281CCE|nr:PfkB family carbohydrate kinase [uncultured Jannaschia sp.]
MASSHGKRAGGRATVRDVARVAGVSIGTVSHVLNDSKAVTDATRRAVLNAVAALDYRPNSLARSLIARRPRQSEKRERERPRLVSIGYISIDYMVQIDSVPRSGERTSSRSIEKMLGGPAANVAAFAAGMGAPLEIHVEMVSHIGTDADSLWALEELERLRIDASGVLQQPGDRLSRCIVMVEDDGQRTIVNEPFQVPVESVARHLGYRATETTAACAHFDGFHLAAAEQMHGALREAGYLLSLHSAGLDPARQTAEGCRGLLETFDLLFLDGDSFARMTRQDPAIATDPSRVFALAPDARCSAVLVTRGAKGAVLLRPGAAPVDCVAPETEVTDVTGAGDAFTGIYLASWLAQGDHEAALRHAVRGASLSVTALGAQGRLPGAVEVADAAIEADA